jgi:hypothetical protein
MQVQSGIRRPGLLQPPAVHAARPADASQDTVAQAGLLLKGEDAEAENVYLGPTRWQDGFPAHEFDSSPSQ